MKTKKQVLQEANQFLNKSGTFACRVCKLLKNSEFAGVLSSQKLAHLLNEGAGKKIKVSSIVPQMKTLQAAEIIQVKIIGKGRNKRNFWFPGWLDKKQVEQQLPSLLSNEGTLFFTGRDSWTDLNNNFTKIITKLQGDLCIVDPYYGDGTFYVLAKFGKIRKIRFLTANLGKKEQNNIPQFNVGLGKFKKEFKNIEMKKYNKPEELHDRYIISKNYLVIIGHGIKDLANKESFVVFLPENLVKNFLPNLRKIFEARWKQSIGI